MSRIVVVVPAAILALSTFASAQVVPSPESAVNPGVIRPHEVKVALETQWIIIDDDDIPVHVDLPERFACEVSNTGQVALLLNARRASRGGLTGAPQTLKTSNGTPVAFVVASTCRVTCRPNVSSGHDTIRLQLVIELEKKSEARFTLNSEVPMGSPLLVHLTTLSEGSAPGHLSQMLLVVTPQATTHEQGEGHRSMAPRRQGKSRHDRTYGNGCRVRCRRHVICQLGRSPH